MAFSPESTSSFTWHEPVPRGTSEVTFLHIDKPGVAWRGVAEFCDGTLRVSCAFPLETGIYRVEQHISSSCPANPVCPTSPAPEAEDLSVFQEDDIEGTQNTNPKEGEEEEEEGEEEEMQEEEEEEEEEEQEEQEEDGGGGDDAVHEYNKLGADGMEERSDDEDDNGSDLEDFIVKSDSEDDEHRPPQSPKTVKDEVAELLESVPDNYLPSRPKRRRVQPKRFQPFPTKKMAATYSKGAEALSSSEEEGGIESDDGEFEISDGDCSSSSNEEEDEDEEEESYESD